MSGDLGNFSGGLTGIMLEEWVAAGYSTRHSVGGMGGTRPTLLEESVAGPSFFHSRAATEAGGISGPSSNRLEESVAAHSALEESVAVRAL